jgi:hypothetical protein
MAVTLSVMAYAVCAGDSGELENVERCTFKRNTALIIDH